MSAVACPKCGKSLKVNDSLLGKRVRCPGCKNPFVVPDAPVVELVEEEEREPEQRVTKQPRRDMERRPSSSRPREEEEDEDRPRPRRRRPRNEDRDSVSFSSAPLVYDILACLLSCAPIIGFILGSMAMSKANAEIDRLPGGKRSRAARKQLQLAKTLGVVGMCLSFVMLILGIVLRITNRL